LQAVKHGNLTLGYRDQEVGESYKTNNGLAGFAVCSPEMFLKIGSWKG